MRRVVTWAAVLVAVLGAVAGGLTGSGQAQAPPEAGIALHGLLHPRGLSETADGDLLAVEVGAGRIWRIGAEGPAVALDGLPLSFTSGPSGAGAASVSAAVQVGDTLWYVVGEDQPEGSPGFQALYRKDPDTDPVLVADFFAYEQANNVDGETDPLELLSNPYHLLVDPAGGFLVSDAGANAIYHVTEDGTITPYAVFLQRDNPDFPDQGPPLMDQVPTGMTFGPDGALYVSTLTGFPFPDGAARVYRLEDLDGDGDALDDGEMTIAAEGLTTATAVAFDTDGSLLVTSFDRSAEVPFLTRGNSGGVFRVRDGVITKVADGQGPTAILVTSAGAALVSDHIAGTITEVAPAVLSLQGGGEFVGWTDLPGKASDFFTQADVAWLWQDGEWVSFSPALPEQLSTDFDVAPGAVIFVNAPGPLEIVIEPMVR